MPYDFELTFTGLCILTFIGRDKSRPDQVNVLLVKTDLPAQAEPGHQHLRTHAHVRHLPLLSFSTARDARPAPGSEAKFTLVPTPEGRQLGIAPLRGIITVDTDEEETNPPGRLFAHWRPGDAPVNTAPDRDSAEEQAWLNWVPSLQKVNPGIKAPTEEPPFAGLKGNQVISQLTLTCGELKAANLARHLNGDFVVWAFKPPGNVPPIARQAMARAVVLRFEGLTEPVWITGEMVGRLGLVGQTDKDKETVRASITNLPQEDVGSMDRLEHFAQFYDAVEWRERPQELSLPEAGGIPDTSEGSDCPNATYTKVPNEVL